jgi:hypothetical protein
MSEEVVLLAKWNLMGICLKYSSPAPGSMKRRLIAQNWSNLSFCRPANYGGQNELNPKICFKKTTNYRHLLRLGTIPYLQKIPIKYRYRYIKNDENFASHFNDFLIPHAIIFFTTRYKFNLHFGWKN